MAVKSKEEILKDLADLAEETGGEKILSLLEDVSDSLITMGEEKDIDAIVKEAVDAKETEWRERYLNRFRGLSEEQVTPPPNSPDEPSREEPLIEGNNDTDIFEEI